MPTDWDPCPGKTKAIFRTFIGMIKKYTSREFHGPVDDYFFSSLISIISRPLK